MTITTTSLDQRQRGTHRSVVEGPLSDSQAPSAAQTGSAVGTLSPQAISFAFSISEPPQGSTSISHRIPETQTVGADGTILPDAIPEPHPTSPPHPGTLSDPAATHHALLICQPRRGPILYSGYLCLLSDSLDDIEQLRMATANRVRALTRSEEDSDGEIRGLGLDARSPEVATAMGMLASLEALEHSATLSLQREIRKSPLYGWVKREKGIGEKQAARLLAVIGDPYWNDLHDRPRTVSELWAYSGYSVIDGAAQRRRKGVLSNWNDKAKSRAFLMAQSCVKSPGGRYSDLYKAERERLTDALHPHDCVRCGPSGKPAIAGSQLSAGHQHARALRKVAKEILKDLWAEARGVHEGEAVR